MDRRQLPDGWEIKKIREIGKVQTGSTPKTSDKNNFGDDISFIKPPDFFKDGSLNYSNQGLSKLGTKEVRIIDKDSVLMVCIGATIGKVGFTEKEVTANQQINSLTPLNGDYPKFIFYQMLTKNFQQKVLDSSGQATLPIINKTKWSELSLFLPSPDEQKRIVAILDEAFEGIDQAIRNTEKNLANARELFESYLNKIFTQKGDGWEQRNFGDICENLDTKRVPITKSKRTSGNIPYYGASGIVDYVADYLFDEDLLLVSEDGANLLARTYPIAFSISGKTWVNNHAHVLRFSGISLQKFVEYYLNSISLEFYISGMAQPKLNQKALNSISVPIAPKLEREQIIKNLDSLTEETQRLETIYRQKLIALNELKQSILQKAFTGQLTK